jgi:hypothetical protein
MRIYLRPEEGTFEMPGKGSGTALFTQAQLMLKLEGISLSSLSTSIFVQSDVLSKTMVN